MKPFPLVAVFLIFYAVSIYAEEKQPLLSKLELFKQEALQKIISETQDISPGRLAFHNAIYSIDPVPAGKTIVCTDGACRQVKCDFAESVTIWFKDMTSEKIVMRDGKQNQEFLGYAAMFTIIGDTRSISISSAPISFEINQ